LLEDLEIPRSTGRRLAAQLPRGQSPRRTRDSGLTATARISRTSASVLCPCWAARTRNARCTSSGRLRTV